MHFQHVLVISGGIGVVIYNDRGWNCVRVQQFIMIDGKIAVVFSSVL